MKKFYYISNINTLRGTISKINNLFNLNNINIVWGNNYHLGNESDFIANRVLDEPRKSLVLIRLCFGMEKYYSNHKLHMYYPTSISTEREIIIDSNQIKVFDSELEFIKNLILD